MKKHDYFCDTCREITHVSPGGHGCWFNSCCWHNERIIWNAKKEQWEENRCKLRLPKSLAAKCSVEGLQDYWKKEVQERWWSERQEQLQKKIEADHARRMQEERARKQKHPQRKQVKQPLIEKAQKSAENTSCLPIWWKYLKAELIQIRDLNRRRNERWRNYDWARERAYCTDGRMIRGGEQRFNSNQKAVLRELRNYYANAAMCGAC